MTFVAGPVTVRVPASSANLGPGFDALGLALTLYDDVTGEVLDGPLERMEIEISGEGELELPRTSDHLVVRAMNAVFDLLGERPAGLRLSCVNAIPHGRGLGSSAAAIVAGVVLARALVSDGAARLDDVAAGQLACDLEGHPDNVAAAFSGGLTIAWLDGTSAGVERLDSTVDVTVSVPPDAVSTEKARGLLPEHVPHGDAAHSAGRAALLVVALTSAPDRLLAATDDRLHQAYRSSAMPDSYTLMQALRADGVAAIISGAGPTVLAFSHGLAGRAPEGWKSLELGVDSDGARILAT